MAGRRMNNEGALYQRSSDGRWFGAVSLGYKDGKLVRKTVSGRTKEEARRKLDELRRHVESGLPVADDRLTLEKFLTRWHDEVLVLQVAMSASDNYRFVYSKHLVPRLGHVRLSKLTAPDVNRRMAEMKEEGLAISTIRRTRSILVQALDEAVRWGVVPRNVARDTKGPRSPKSAPADAGRSLTEEQARALLKAAKEHRLGLVYVLMLSLGLRKGEALGLQWRDVRMPKAGESTGTLTIRHAMRHEGSEVVLGDVKTPRSRRKVRFPRQIADDFRAHKAAQAGERRKVGEAWTESDLVFTTEVGTSIAPNVTRDDFAKLCKAAGLGHWTPHELRHSAASLMLARGVPLEVVSEVLGHASIRITADVYAHLQDRQLESAAETMAGALWG